MLELSKAFFNLITQQWHSNGAEYCLFVVQCLGENKNALSQKFSYKKIPDANEFAKGINDQNYNVYTTTNPINSNIERNARDENESLAFSILQMPMIMPACKPLKVL